MKDRATLHMFIVGKAAEARASQQRRLGMAAEWRDGTDADWKAGKQLGERMAGRRLGPVMSATSRAQLAQADERIAAKHGVEADMFEAVAALLTAEVG